MSSTSSLPKYYENLFDRTKTQSAALFLAPMEGLADRRFRKAISLKQTNYFDDICQEFIRIPSSLPEGALKEKFVKKLSIGNYDSNELIMDAMNARGLGRGRLLSAQIMGSNSELLECSARFLADEGGAPRVDLNCGCPANVVTGKGAGSSLLRNPELVYECMKAVSSGCEGSNAVASLKMRVGFDDTRLFRENVIAACEGGAKILTVHGRTKKQGYSGEADWTKIAEAVEICRSFGGVKVIGNGDVTSCERVARMLRETDVDGVMIGRGAVQDPLLFRRIKSRIRRDGDKVTLLSKEEAIEEEKMGDEAEHVILFMRAFYDELIKAEDIVLNSSSGRQRFRTSKKGVKQTNDSRRVGKLKSIVKYLFTGNVYLSDKMSEVVGVADHEMSSFEMLERVEALIRMYWKGEPAQHISVDNFSLRTKYDDSTALFAV